MLSEAEVYQPENLDDLDGLLTAAKKKMTFVAGSTDLMVNPDRWQLSKQLIDLSRVTEICRTMKWTDGGLLIGAALPISYLIRDGRVRQQFPILIESLRQIGSVQIQNRATLGGNIGNASPAGDSLPVLSVLDADIWIGPKNNGDFRTVKIGQMMQGPGQTLLRDNEYIAYIFIPLYSPHGSYWYFRKVGQREALAISKVSLALLGRTEQGIVRDIRIATGSVSPVIDRAAETEKVLRGNPLEEEIIERARRTIVKEVTPISDIRSTQEYRRRVAGELLREALYQWMTGN